MTIYLDQTGKPHRLPAGTKPALRTSCYGVIFRNKKLLLVQQRLDDCFGFPGGGIEKNENEQTALSREIREETGYTVETISPQPFFAKKTHFFAKDIEQFFDSTMKYYHVTIRPARPGKITDTDEIKQAKWILLHNAPQIVSAAHQEVLAALRTQI